MRNFDVDIQSEIAKEALNFFFLIKFEFTSTYCFTDSDVPVYYDGYRYEPRGFKFNEISLAGDTGVDKISVDVNNEDLVFSAILLGEDVRNKMCTIYFGVNLLSNFSNIAWDAGIEWMAGVEWTETQIIGITPPAIDSLFVGILGSWTIKGDKNVTIEIDNEFILWNKKTLRNHSPLCTWTFKDTHCGYTGSAIFCDKSYDMCLGFGNDQHKNFGGFRFLPSIQDKEIWWGRKPENS